MKALVKYKSNISQETIDLTDYGFQESIKWEDIPEDKQLAIQDSLREDTYIQVSVDTIED